jgi:hypothetical protein
VLGKGAGAPQRLALSCSVLGLVSKERSGSGQTAVRAWVCVARAGVRACVHLFVRVEETDRGGRGGGRRGGPAWRWRRRRTKPRRPPPGRGGRAQGAAALDSAPSACCAWLGGGGGVWCVRWCTCQNICAGNGCFHGAASSMVQKPSSAPFEKSGAARALDRWCER